jgi:hypothetical protein
MFVGTKSRVLQVKSPTKNTVSLVVRMPEHTAVQDLQAMGTGRCFACFLIIRRTVTKCRLHSGIKMAIHPWPTLTANFAKVD